jgi:fatty-acyl-CoA synthase
MMIDRWNNREGISDWYNISDSTWGNVLNISAERYRNNVAIIFNDKEVTFKDLREKVDIFANGLLSIGVKPGENVCLWMKNSIEWVIAQFSIYKLGCRIVPVNTRYCLMEVEYVVRQSDCACIIMDDEFHGNPDAINMIKVIRGKIANGMEDDSNRNILRNIICNSRNDNYYKDTVDFRDILRIGSEKEMRTGIVERQVVPSSDLCIQYTSGTTGFPKGVICTHRSTIASFYCTGIGAGYKQGTDTLLVSLPLYTNAGALGCSATAILFGLKMVLLDQYDPEVCLKKIVEHKVSLFIGSDNMFVNILRHKNVKYYDISSLRGGIMAGGHNPVNVIKEVIRIFPELTMVYGLTENSGVGTLVLYDDPYEKRLCTSGRAMPYTRIAIKDIETGKILKNNQKGEICTHDVLPNSSVMIGYYKKEAETKEAIDPDGWLHTGDIGYLDDDEYLVVTGRLKDMFTTSGNNVYPAEIENYLHSHFDVKIASVVGIPDEIKGAVPMAFIVLNDGSRVRPIDIIDYCKNNISSYKIPKYVEFIKEMPLTSSGKIKKNELKEYAIKKFELEKVARDRYL